MNEHVDVVMIIIIINRTGFPILYIKKIYMIALHICFSMSNVFSLYNYCDDNKKKGKTGKK